MYRTARIELLWTILQIAIAPFGTVRFRDFFFADIITSIGKTLNDIGFITVYYTSDYQWKRSPIDKKDVSSLYYYSLIVAFAPFWWRFWQCINKAIL